MSNRRKSEQKVPRKRRNPKENSLAPLLYINQAVISDPAEKKKDSFVAQPVRLPPSRIDSRRMQQSQSGQQERTEQSRRQSSNRAINLDISTFPGMGIFDETNDNVIASDEESQIDESTLHSGHNEIIEEEIEEDSSSNDSIESVNETTTDEFEQENMSEVCKEEIEITDIHAEPDLFPDVIESEQELDVQPMIIKVPVLLANVNTELTVQSCYSVATPMTSINRVDWAVKEIKGQVYPHSNVVYLKGILIANVEYVKEGPNHNIMQEKINIPWSKTTNITWINRPDWPHKQYEEYTFHTHEGDGEFEVHREMFETFAEEVHYDIDHIQVVSVTRIETSTLAFDAEVNLSITLSQNQYVNLNSYSRKNNP
ncbi:hypothetical protein [Aneurinibacillus soli]|nr:hypothetical protein [Aneurinibacillus soli]